MAEESRSPLKQTTPTATSPRLDYGLGGDILNRLAEAAEVKDTAFGDAMTDISADFVEAGKDIKVKEEKEQEEKEQLEDDVLDREAAWYAKFDAMRNRATWASEDLYVKFEAYEESQKELYLQAVRDGDKKTQNALLRAQTDRYSSTNGWKAIIEMAEETERDDLYSNYVLQNDPDAVHIIGELAAQENFDIDYNENNEMIFKVNMPNGEVRDVTLREVQGWLEGSLKANKAFAEVDVVLNTVKEMGIKDLTSTELEEGSQDYNRVKKSITRSVKEQNIKSWLTDVPDYADQPFIEDLIEGAEYQYLVKDIIGRLNLDETVFKGGVDNMLMNFDTNNDKKLDSGEIATLMENRDAVRQVIMESINSNNLGPNFNKLKDAVVAWNMEKAQEIYREGSKQGQREYALTGWTADGYTKK